MHGYYLGYLRTSGGQLKMFEVIVGLVQLFYLMAVNYDRNHDWYVLRMDLLIMLMGTFTAVFAASFVLLTVILGSTEKISEERGITVVLVDLHDGSGAPEEASHRVPFSLLYRLLYLALCVVMIPATAVFLKETRIHSSTRELIVSATVSVCFCVGLLGNFVLAYKPTIFETKVTQRAPRENKPEGGGH